LGLHQLQLKPAEFWALTPVEFLMMLGLSDGPRALTRDGLSRLMAQFPDEEKEEINV
jgi:uncharacterized phage protein (TIGR02216 family)